MLVYQRVGPLARKKIPPSRPSPTPKVYSASVVPWPLEKAGGSHRKLDAGWSESPFTEFKRFNVHYFVGCITLSYDVWCLNHEFRLCSSQLWCLTGYESKPWHPRYRKIDNFMNGCSFPQIRKYYEIIGPQIPFRSPFAILKPHSFSHFCWVKHGQSTFLAPRSIGIFEEIISHGKGLSWSSEERPGKTMDDYGWLMISND